MAVFRLLMGGGGGRRQLQRHRHARRSPRRHPVPPAGERDPRVPPVPRHPRLPGPARRDRQGFRPDRLIPASPCTASASTPSPPPARTASASSPESDRKSTRLNSSHHSISYAVFCLKKKKT